MKSPPPSFRRTQTTRFTTSSSSCSSAGRTKLLTHATRSASRNLLQGPITLPYGAGGRAGVVSDGAGDHAVKSPSCAAGDRHWYRVLMVRPLRSIVQFGAGRSSDVL